MAIELKDELFTSGLDVGDFVLKAEAKVPVSKFPFSVPQEIVERMDDKYSSRLKTLLRDIEDRLLRSERMDKGGDLLVCDLNKAEAKAKKTPSGEKKERKPVKSPGIRGGKFWIDKKGNVKYGERPDEEHEEAKPEEVAKYAKEHLTPTIFVGHDKNVLDAILNSKYFSPHNALVIKHFQSKLKEGLKATGYTKLEDISAEEFKTSSKKKGPQALASWLQENFYENVDWTDDDGEWVDDKEKRTYFRDLLKRYDNATKDPAVQAQLAISAAQHMDDVSASSAGQRDTAAIAGVDMMARLISPSNVQDAALEGMTLMRALSCLIRPMNGRELGRTSDGSSNRHMIGQIHVNTNALNAMQSGEIKLENSTPAQMIAYAITAELGNASQSDKGDYDENTFRNSDGSLKTGLDSFFLGHELEETLRGSHKGEFGAGDEKHYAQRISELGDSILQLINKQHKGGNSALEKIMQGNAILKLKSEDTAGDIRAEIQQTEEEAKALMDAQADAELAIPKGNMQDGIYNGKTLVTRGPAIGEIYKLFDHQKQAVNWMEKAERGILAHGTGLGKTLEVVTFIEHMKNMRKGKGVERGVMFLPPALISQWTDEIKQYAPGSNILNLSEYDSEDRAEILKTLGPNADYIFVSKGLLTSAGRDDETASPGGKDYDVSSLTDNLEAPMDNEMIDAIQALPNAALFVDEVHQGGFKNPKNAANQLTRKVLSKAKYAFGMTATPVPNSAEDLFHLTDTFAPGTVGDMATWQGRLAHNEWDPETESYKITNYEDLEELNDRIKPRVMIRKFDDPDIKEKMAKWAPKDPTDNIALKSVLLSNDRHTSTGHSQEDYVNTIAPVMASVRLDSLIKRREERGEKPYDDNALKLMYANINLMIQRQAMISPALIHKAYKGPAGKINDTAQVVVDHFMPGGHAGKNNSGIVIFSNFKKTFSELKIELANRGFDPSLIGEIHGDSQFDRGAIQDAFNEGKLKIMLVGIKAGGAGLNLQKKANHMVFVDEPYTATDKEQAIGRVWRTGQAEDVKMTKMHVPESYDDRLTELIRNKGILAHLLTARDFKEARKGAKKKADLLGAGKPPPTLEEALEGLSPAERTKYTGMANELEINPADLENFQFSDGYGSLDPEAQPIKVNEAARKKLPKHLQTTHDMKAYEKARKDKNDTLAAKGRLEQFDAAEKMYREDVGNLTKASKYRKKAFKLRALLGEAQPSADIFKKVKKLGAPEKGTVTLGGSGVSRMKQEATTKLPGLKKKKHTYASSDKPYKSSRNVKVGGETKIGALSQADLGHFFNEFKAKAPKTMGAFVTKVINPALAAAKMKLSEKDKLKIAHQTLYHFEQDGLI